jgi:hypothetical protein
VREVRQCDVREVLEGRDDTGGMKEPARHDLVPEVPIITEGRREAREEQERMRKVVVVSWIVWTVVESSALAARSGRPTTNKNWTMGLATETKTECEVALATEVRHVQEWAATGAKDGMTAHNLPNGARLEGQRTRIERRVECWPAGADPRGTR